MQQNFLKIAVKRRQLLSFSLVIINLTLTGGKNMTKLIKIKEKFKASSEIQMIIREITVFRLHK